MNKLILFSIAVLLLPGLVAAQDKVVTGVVKDANGPLAGATITEKQESRNAVAADSRGHFRIMLHGTSGVLIISYLNYQQQEVNVKKDNNIEVVMQPSVQGMEELVVVGFGKRNGLPIRALLAPSMPMRSATCLLPVCRMRWQVSCLGSLPNSVQVSRVRTPPIILSAE